MRLIDRIKTALREDEGLRLKPYRCTANKLTIGYGRNLEDKGISEGEAYHLLTHDCIDAMNEADAFSWYRELSDIRKAVVVNMIFNLGINRFKGFKRMIAHIEQGAYDRASVEMLDSRWAEQVGSRSERLAEEMRNG